jgi:hypothetical protein
MTTEHLNGAPPMRKRSEARRTASPESEPPRATRLEYSDLTAALTSVGKVRDWTVEGVIEGTPLIALIGPEKGGKSWMLGNLAIAIATGGKWLGSFKSCVCGDVCVVENENGPEETSRRFARNARGAGIDPTELLRKGGPIRHYWATDFLLSEDNEAFQGLLEDLEANPPKLVILDPYRNFVDGDENSPKDNTKALRCIAMIREAGQCTVAFGHHLNKQGHMTGARTIKTRADLIIEGTDEAQPWYSVVGRKIRASDPISKPFTVDIVHTDDDDDTIATTKLVCKFKGDAKGKGELTKSAERMLAALKGMKGHKGTQNAIGEAAGVTSGKVRKRALEELEERGLAKHERTRWSLSTREFFATRRSAENGTGWGPNDV